MQNAEEPFSGGQSCRVSGSYIDEEGRREFQRLIDEEQRFAEKGELYIRRLGGILIVMAAAYFILSATEFYLPAMGMSVFVTVWTVKCMRGSEKHFSRIRRVCILAVINNIRLLIMLAGKSYVIMFDRICKPMFLNAGIFKLGYLISTVMLGVIIYFFYFNREVDVYFKKASGREDYLKQGQ